MRAETCEVYSKKDEKSSKSTRYSEILVKTFLIGDTNKKIGMNRRASS